MEERERIALKWIRLRRNKNKNNMILKYCLESRGDNRRRSNIRIKGKDERENTL